MIKRNLAFGDASSAIGGKIRGRKNPCQEFFTKGRSLQQVTDIFKHYWQTATDNPELADLAGTKNSGQGMDATVELGNPFYSEGPPVYQWSPVNNRYLEQTTNLTPRQYRALTILHEFAHALGLIPRDGPKADPTGTQSEKNNQTIYQKCGAFLDALPLD